MRRQKFNLETLPASPNLEYERRLWSSGFQYVGGIDEAGRGALAGPVTAAVAILPPDAAVASMLHGVRDSKQMTPKGRAYWAERIKDTALAWGVGQASNLEIDEMGIVPAVRLAICRALDSLAVSPQHLLIDYLELPEVRVPQTALVKGDARCLSIAAASVLAKTARDAELCKLEAAFPGYGLGQHKGYGTLRHRIALQQSGPSPVHRRTFRVKDEVLAGE